MSEKTNEETETIQFDRSFPEPAQPDPNAVLIDWRFNEFTLTLQEKDKNGLGEVYSTTRIIGNEKQKGKANRNAFIIFAMPIIYATPIIEQEN